MEFSSQSTISSLLKWQLKQVQRNDMDIKRWIKIALFSRFFSPRFLVMIMNYPKIRPKDCQLIQYYSIGL